MTDYTGQITATEDIMRPQTPYKLTRPAARVYGQGAPARLVVTLKIECPGRALPLRGSARCLWPRTPAVLRRHAPERPSPLVTAHPGAGGVSRHLPVPALQP